MARENAHDKGRRYLTEGRLMLRLVTADEIAAVCRGDGHVYHCGWRPGQWWWCDCPARTDRCAHLTALRLVTVTQGGR